MNKLIAIVYNIVTSLTQTWFCLNGDATFFTDDISMSHCSSEQVTDLCESFVCHLFVIC